MTSPSFTIGHAAFHPRPGPPENTSPAGEHPPPVDKDQRIELLEQQRNVLNETCRDLRATIAALELDRSELHAALAQANQTIEDVCCGTRLTCPKCNKLQPCLCQNAP